MMTPSKLEPQLNSLSLDIDDSKPATSRRMSLNTNNTPVIKRKTFSVSWRESSFENEFWFEFAFLVVQKTLRKTLSTSSATLGGSLSALSAARVHLRVSYDSTTHVLTLFVIQSSKLVQSEKQKLFNKVQFQTTLECGQNKIPTYKTNFLNNSDLIDIKETFYFPNIAQGIPRILLS